MEQLVNGYTKQSSDGYGQSSVLSANMNSPYGTSVRSSDHAVTIAAVRRRRIEAEVEVEVELEVKVEVAVEVEGVEVLYRRRWT